MDVFKLVLFYMFCCLGGRWWLMLLFLGSGFACDLMVYFWRVVCCGVLVV